jgi:ABC-type transport system involved in multi-copper enzyme maturation permease subunit
MTFLPIVQRELREASRRKSTFRLRWVTAIFAIAFGFVALAFLGTGVGYSSLGQIMFSALTRYAFVLSLLAGVFFTADSLSREKREGTLGLLFLTDLKGYDVVLGKFVAVSLNALYGLLAILPAAAIPLLLGGVTGSEYWRMALALFNALFISLAVGSMISALSRNSHRSTGNASGLILLLAGVLPCLSLLWKGWSYPSYISPAYPFLDARESAYLIRPDRFWYSLAASHLMGWIFLAVASFALPHCWQAKPISSGHESTVGRLRRWISFLAIQPKANTKLLSINPVLWLASRRREGRLLAWAIVLAWGATVVGLMLFAPPGQRALWLGWFSIWPFGFVLKVVFAFQTCRFFAEARRSGELELLLCTPLTNREIVWGQSLALRRGFLLPVLAFLGLMLFPSLAQIGVAIPKGDVHHVFTGGSQLALSGVICIRTIADFLAICLFGMGMALTTKKPHLAAAQTVFWVLLLPSLLCWMDLVADIFFIAWGAAKLQQDFRRVLGQQYESASRQAMVRPLTGGMPPVIPISVSS